MISFQNDIELMLDTQSANIAYNMVETGSNASGLTMRSLEVSTGGLFGGTSGALLGSETFPKIEKGTSPGTPISFWQILKWVQYKGIASGDGAKRAAGAITNSIRNKGTRTYQRGGRTDIYTDVVNNEDLINDLAENMAETTQRGLYAAFDKYIK